MTKSGRPNSGGFWEATRALITGLIVIVIVLGFTLVIASINKAKNPSTNLPGERVDILANSRDECITCHRQATPGIVGQFGSSTMAAAEVTCRNCHEVAESYGGAVAHEGTFVLSSPTPAKCRNCHAKEVAEYYASRHSAPAYAAIAGVEDFTPAQMAIYEAIPEGSYNPDKIRHALYAIEGPEVTTFACRQCHEIGLPNADDSIGKCQKCHLRHEFSLAQARKPETCNNCHIGPDHPQWEIYFESPHGIATSTMGDHYNWDADPGTITVNDFPAPNCATCHISGFGGAATTHDVGERLTWYLFAPKSDRRPAWEDNQTRMQNVCRECHNEEFISGFYEKGDACVNEINTWVQESDDIADALKAAGFMNPTPFDEPMDFTYFDLWHHWGRTASFGAWMQGADYTQWHGAYEMLRELADMREFARENLGDANYPLTSAPVTESTSQVEGVH